MALALIEHAAGRVDELSLQALSLARDVAGDAPVEALLAGPAPARPPRSSARTAWRARKWPRTSGSRPTPPRRGRTA
jgi:hypothetical protein